MLAYHSVGDDAGRPFARWQLSRRLLEDQLAAVTEAGVRLTALTPALASRDVATVGLTVDDGFADFLDALPVIERYARSATLYVPSGLVGGRARWLVTEGEDHRRLMSWDDLAALPDEIEIGSHSRTHPALDVLPPVELAAEVAGSKTELEQRLGRSVGTFAYPFGFHDARARRAVRSAGYGSACEVGYRRHHRGRSPLAVSRLLVTPGTTPEQLVRLVTGRAVQLRRLTRPARPLYRQVRWQRARGAVR